MKYYTTLCYTILYHIESPMEASANPRTTEAGANPRNPNRAERQQAAHEARAPRNSGCRLGKTPETYPCLYNYIIIYVCMYVCMYVYIYIYSVYIYIYIWEGLLQEFARSSIIAFTRSSSVKMPHGTSNYLCLSLSLYIYIYKPYTIKQLPRRTIGPPVKHMFVCVYIYICSSVKMRTGAPTRVRRAAGKRGFDEG